MNHSFVLLFVFCFLFFVFLFHKTFIFSFFIFYVLICDSDKVDILDESKETVTQIIPSKVVVIDREWESGKPPILKENKKRYSTEIENVNVNVNGNGNLRRERTLFVTMEQWNDRLIQFDV